MRFIPTYQLPITLIQSHSDGSDGDLIIANGEVVEIAPNSTKQYNNLTIELGGTLRIIEGQGICYIGVKNTFILDGIIDARSNIASNFAFTRNTPINVKFTCQIQQANGGSGGMGGSSWGGSSGYRGGFGRAQQSGNGGGGGGGAIDGAFGVDAPIQASFLQGGNGGYGHRLGNGGIGGVVSDITTTRNGKNGLSGGPDQAGSGGGGGARGYHGHHVIVYADKVLGNGSINCSGGLGGNGGVGGNIPTGGRGGGAGGGGAGAGGSGGNIFIRYRLELSSNINYIVQRGLAGTRGPVNGSGEIGGRGSWGIAGGVAQDGFIGKVDIKKF